MTACSHRTDELLFGPLRETRFGIRGEIDRIAHSPRAGKGGIGAGTNTAFAGPWGVSYSINLTSDAETGLAKWTEQQFIGAMRTGRHLGVSRPILPPMPWDALRQMTDQDLNAMFAYLRTVPAIRNRVPDAVPAPAPPPAAGQKDGAPTPGPHQ